MRLSWTSSAILALCLLALPAWQAGAQAPAVADPASDPSLVSAAEAPQAPPVTLEQIMAHPDWLGNAPENPYWADDGRSFFYFQKRKGEEHRDLIHADLDGNLLATVADADRGAVDSPDGQWSRDRTLKVYEREGDLFLKQIFTGKILQLTRTAAAERNPAFMAGDRAIRFQRGDSIFVRDLVDGLEYQAAELIAEKDPEEVEREKEEKAGYLERQQSRLLDHVRQTEERREKRREREKAARLADPTRTPPPWYLGEGIEIRRASLSPNGRWMIVVTGKKDEDDGRADQMPNYVTASGYVEVREVRPKVGTGEDAGEKLVLLDLRTREQFALDLGVLPGIFDDPLAFLKGDEKSGDGKGGIEEEDLALEEEELADDEIPAETIVVPVQETSSDPPPPAPDGTPGISGVPGPQSRGSSSAAGGEEKKSDEPTARALTFSFFGPVWSRDGEQVALQAYSADNKDRWLLTVDFAAKALRPIHRLQDEAWINWNFNEFGWLEDDQTLFYLSEETGHSHLYLVDGRGQERRALTFGDYLVREPQPSADGAYVYFSANRDHPGIYETYRVDLASGAVEQITRLGGLNRSRLSPDGATLLIEHSTTTRPPELYVQPAAPGAPATPVTRTVSDAFTAVPWVEPQIVEIPSSHVSQPIYSRLYLPDPEVFPPGEPRPAVLFTHGAGYLQNSHQGWSGYFREFMFHTLLTQAGYVVLDMDYRASAGYGRDWRTAIYRQMGTPELEDLRDGVMWLVANQNVDRQRIGTYGGSYGGFLTMMALFTQQDLFASGAALRPVTDWAHYNHPYTSNILNTPEVDPEAYERSSPIEFADGLEKPLLICAPMLDDNVFFQDTVRLAQRLIELEKEDWEVAIFPIEPHGFREPSSWLDEYRRIFKLFETTLKP